MKNVLLGIYAIWVVALIGVAYYGWFVKGIGEYGVSSHLWLVITGLPSSLVSLSAQNGSLKGVALAGVLGLAQWYLILKYSSRRK